jgi:hypothetical protein
MYEGGTRVHEFRLSAAQLMRFGYPMRILLLRARRARTEICLTGYVPTCMVSTVKRDILEAGPPFRTDPTRVFVALMQFRMLTAWYLRYS